MLIAYFGYIECEGKGKMDEELLETLHTFFVAFLQI